MPTRTILALAAAVGSVSISAAAVAAEPEHYEHKETLALVKLVDDAAGLISTKGEAAFQDLQKPGSRWRRGESYVFVLDPKGNMRVHPDPALQGKNDLGLKDVNGKPIIRGLIAAATALPEKNTGWYHYQWPVPGGLLPRWKSTFVRRVMAPSGKSYIVGSGMYNDRMERPFVVDMVTQAVGLIEKDGSAAFDQFRDPASAFRAKDAYVFVVDMANGDALVHPAFPNLEGKSLLDVRDTKGNLLIREMIQVARTKGSGWVDYMWPKPGESVSTRKSTYVRVAKMGDKRLLVGSGVYLANAPTAPLAGPRLTAPELMAHVRDGASVLEKEGEKAYSEFRKKGSRWYRDGLYFFVWSMDGKRVFHPVDPQLEGRDASDEKDILGRP